MIGLLLVILVAAIVYWLLAALGLPFIICVIAAILVLICGIGYGGPRSGWYGRRGPPV